MGNIYFFSSIVLLSFVFGCSDSKKEPSPSNVKTQYVGGIQINEADQLVWANTLKACGMNLAQVTAYAKQGNWDSDHLWWEDQDTIHVINEIRAMKAQDVHVLMVLRVALQHNQPNNKFKWHGMIYPRTEAQKEEWFYRYNYFVEMWAKICEREGVDIFAIGSELNALTATVTTDTLPALLNFFSDTKKQKKYLSKVFKHSKHLGKDKLWVRGFENYDNEQDYINDKIKEQKIWADQVCYAGHSNNFDLINKDRKYLNNTWIHIIANARKYYSGKLTMATNFDNYQEVDFWQNLDFLGINAYFPLRPYTKEPFESKELYQKLLNGWGRVLDDIDDFKAANNIVDLPVFFTEIGYTPKAGATIRPWQGDGFSLLSNENIDTVIVWKNATERPEERAYAVKALQEIVLKKSFPLVGLSYWKMTTHAYHRGYEPFLLLLDEKSPTPLQLALSNFLR